MRNSKSQTFATTLRKQPTDAERCLWRNLRLRQINGLKFRRQYPIGPYIADFACLEARLIVEVDGGQHSENANSDALRDRFLAKNNFRVLRFWNSEVLQETDAVLQVILDALHAPIPAFPRKQGKETGRDT